MPDDAKYGYCYPGRKLPPTQKVEDAKCDEGAAKRARAKQIDSNSKEINKHVAQKEGQ